MPQTLKRVYRLDSIPINQTYYTAEGYLVDRPIVTSTGIFEYIKPDGTVRRELRLPEDVFDPESLKSYRGKPIIVTHDAGIVTNKNVGNEQIGTIMSDGYRSGDDVRAEIIIHDTNAMKAAGLKELSLGYNLDLDETPGEWNGQKYDAIQHNIRINHLALVRDARAGDRARLNIDSRDTKKSLEGEKSMKNTKKTTRGDGILTPEELAKAVEEYKARRANRAASKQDTDDPPAAKQKVEGAEPAVPTATPIHDGDDVEVPDNTPVDETSKKVEEIKANRGRRDQEEPADKEAAMGVIAQQDEDMGILFDIIDTLLAQADFGKAESAAKTDGDPDELEKLDGCGKKDGEGCENEGDDGCDNEDEDDEDEIPAASIEAAKMNTDSVDRIVRERIKLGMIGQKLNLGGLENKGIMAAKKEVIRTVRPAVRLDGKSAAYINAAFDMACEEVSKRDDKGTAYQKKQMFNRTRMDSMEESDSSARARQRMIDRENKKED